MTQSSKTVTTRRGWLTPDQKCFQIMLETR